MANFKTCNMIISGGASHGADLWGAALVALTKYRPVRLAGASIGAVTAAGLACGMSPSELQAQLVKFFQKNTLTGGKAPIGIRPRVIWARGGGLNDWSHVAAALKSIFGNKKMGDVRAPLCIVVSDVYTRRPVYITSTEDPEVLIWEALAASTAVWPVADAQTIPSLGRGNRLYIDGGWSDNCPVTAWGDTAEPNVVLYLAPVDNDHDTLPDPVRTEGVADILGAALELALYASPAVPGRKQDVLVPIATQGSGFDFDLTEAEIKRRIKNGVDQCRRLV